MYSIKAGKKTSKFDNVEVNKKKFDASTQAVALDILNINQILISGKFEHSHKDFEYFIGYKGGNIIRPLCTILPQISGYIKYFKNGQKNKSFMIEGDIKFCSTLLYDEKYIKATVA